ncbi:MAG: Cro/Cl family transcriptional regulator [Candidatus Dadabacteria bacterium]
MMLQEEIGQRIKKFRLEKGITQRELATRASLSKGYISQLEKGLTLPSLPNLKEILDVLGITLSEFFSEKNPIKVVYSKKDKVTLPSTNDGIKVELLIPSYSDKDFDLFLVTLEPKTKTKKEQSHRGEETGHVISGSLTIVLGSREFNVKKGESYFIIPDRPHYIENRGKSPCVALHLVSPGNLDIF